MPEFSIEPNNAIEVIFYMHDLFTTGESVVKQILKSTHLTPHLIMFYFAFSLLIFKTLRSIIQSYLKGFQSVFNELVLVCDSFYQSDVFLNTFCALVILSLCAGRNYKGMVSKVLGESKPTFSGEYQGPSASALCRRLLLIAWWLLSNLWTFYFMIAMLTFKNPTNSFFGGSHVPVNGSLFIINLVTVCYLTIQSTAYVSTVTPPNYINNSDILEYFITFNTFKLGNKKYRMVKSRYATNSWYAITVEQSSDDGTFQSTVFPLITALNEKKPGSGSQEVINVSSNFSEIKFQFEEIRSGDYHPK